MYQSATRKTKVKKMIIWSHLLSLAITSEEVSGRKSNQLVEDSVILNRLIR